MRQGFSLKLSGRIFLVMALAVLIPLALLVIFSFVSVRDVSIENLDAFLEESGQGRVEKIQNEFETAFTLVNDFVEENQLALIRIITPRRESGPINPSEEQRLEESNLRNRIISELISSNHFNSISLFIDAPLRKDIDLFSAVSAQNQVAPSFPESVNNVASPPVQAVLDLTGTMAANKDRQALLVTELNGVTRMMLLTTIYERDPDTDEEEAIGYMLVDLNLDNLIVSNLAGETTSYDTYAYVMLLENSYVATNPELVDLTSNGARRAFAGETGTDTYQVGEEGFQRNVIGYTAWLSIEERNFGFVVEANENAIGGLIFDRGASYIFPFTILGLCGSILLFIYLRRNIVNPTGRLREAMLAMIGGDFEHPVKDASRNDELGLLATSFVDLRDNVRDLTEDMNRRLRERTRDVQVTQDIGRAVTAERDLERLMNRVVNLIVQNFPSIYHAQIFLLDEDKQYAVLRASTGQAGRELLSRGHKLGVGSVSVLGQVTEQGQTIIARDTAESSVHRQNEFLGETRAELAIPLRLGNDIIGALDVQSKLRDSFDEDQVAALQTLADQITIAIENARLYAESARLLASIEQERGASTRNAWKQYMHQERKDSLIVHSGVKTDYEFEKLSLAVLNSGKSLVGDATSRNTIPFAVPIVLRGQTLGVVEYEVPQAEFNYDKVLLAEELVARLAISMENARLFQSSQQSAERERIVNAISTKLTGQTDIEDILQTAIREVGQALRTPQVAIRLTAAEVPNGNGSHENDKPNQ